MSRVVLTVVPAVSVAIVAIGLRLGAGESVRGAIVYGTPRGAKATSWFWQVRTFSEYWGTRETLSVGLHATVDAGGKRVVTNAHTNDDGVAELELATDARPEQIELRADDTNEVLASGAVHWEDVPWRNDDGETWVKPTSRGGPILISIAAPGGRLIAGFPGTLVVRVEGAPGSEVQVTAEGDGALDVATTKLVPCPSGRGALTVTPLLHVAAITLRAKGKDGRVGDWFGPVPVAHGGMRLGSLDVTDATTVTSPGTARRAYFEIDDDVGRVRAGIIDLVTDATEPLPHAGLSFQGLPEGDYWVVLSPEPTGAEKLQDASIARRVHVGKDALDPCVALDRLTRTARGFPRWVAIDGMVGRHLVLARRRGRGRTVALLGLFSGALVEFLLVVRAARAAKRNLERLERGGANADVRRRFGALEVALALALSMLGFALLAALVSWSS
jgi:hypothetical protein